MEVQLSEAEERKAWLDRVMGYINEDGRSGRECTTRLHGQVGPISSDNDPWHESGTKMKKKDRVCHWWRWRAIARSSKLATSICDVGNMSCRECWCPFYCPQMPPSRRHQCLTMSSLLTHTLFPLCRTADCITTREREGGRERQRGGEETCRERER